MQCVLVIDIALMKSFNRQQHIESGPASVFITALRIHLSATTKELLEEFETFNLQERGPIDLKVGDFVLRTKTSILKEQK